MNCNDNNPCTNDGCLFGDCWHGANSNPCDDGNNCTTGDVCTGGVGSGTCAGNPVVCDDNNDCTFDYCFSGSCEYVSLDEFLQLPCNDGNACTQNEYCAWGQCVGGVVINCNDNNSCTNDSCDNGNCVNTPNYSCGDGVCSCGENASSCSADCSSPTSCAGNCGGSAGECYCDSACLGAGDCCDDACVLCDQCPNVDSCLNQCGSASTLGGCSCQDNCDLWGDCCDDYWDWCF